MDAASAKSAQSNNKIMLIVILVIGAMVVLAGGITVTVFLLKRKKQRKPTLPPEPLPPPSPPAEQLPTPPLSPPPTQPSPTPTVPSPPENQPPGEPQQPPAEPSPPANDNDNLDKLLFKDTAPLADRALINISLNNFNDTRKNIPLVECLDKAVGLAAAASDGDGAILTGFKFVYKSKGAYIDLIKPRTNTIFTKSVTAHTVVCYDKLDTQNWEGFLVNVETTKAPTLNLYYGTLPTTDTSYKLRRTVVFDEVDTKDWDLRLLDDAQQFTITTQRTMYDFSIMPGVSMLLYFDVFEWQGAPLCVASLSLNYATQRIDVSKLPTLLALAKTILAQDFNTIVPNDKFVLPAIATSL